MRAWLIVLGLVLPCVASAGVFHWVDERGRVHFGDQPPKTSEAQHLDLRINTYESPPMLQGDLGATTREVVMYSTAWCATCKRAKRYFEKNGIPYVEYDIEASAQGRSDYLRLGGRGVPIILVGDRRLNGFSPSAFEQVYNPR